MVIGIAAPPPAGQPVVMAVLVYNGPEDEAKEFFGPLLKLNPIANTTQMMSYKKLNSMMNEGMDPGLRRTMKGSAFKAPLSPKYASSLFSEFESFRKQVPDAIATVIILEFVSYHKIMEVEQTATAFANRGAYANVVFAPGWTKKEYDGECRAWSREMGRKTREELMRRIEEEETDSITKDGVGEYVNYDSEYSSSA
jgi:hypothetical protein